MKSEVVKQAEKEFQEVLPLWRADSTNNRLKERLWMLVYNCCSNICKSRLVGISIGEETFKDRVMDATVLCMHYIIDNNKNPDKLSSFCFLPCIGILYGKKAKQEDSEVSYEEQEELGNVATVDILGNVLDFPKGPEDVRGICRKDLMNTLD